jgi:hypothetical protein
MEQLMERLEISPRKRIAQNNNGVETTKKQADETLYEKSRHQRLRIAPSHKSLQDILVENRQPPLFWEEKFNSGEMEFNLEGIPTWLFARKHGNVVVFVLDLLRRCHAKYPDHDEEVSDKQAERMARAMQIGFGPPTRLNGTNIAECIIPDEKSTDKPYRKLAHAFTVPRQNVRPIF